MTERSTTHVSTSRPEPTLAEFGYGLRTEGVPLPWEVHVFHARARRAEVAKYEVSLRYALDSGDLRTKAHEALELIVHGLKVCAVHASPSFDAALRSLRHRTSRFCALLEEGRSRAEIVAGMADDIIAVLAECDQYRANLNGLIRAEQTKALSRRSEQATSRCEAPTQALTFSFFQAAEESGVAPRDVAIARVDRLREAVLRFAEQLGRDVAAVDGDSPRHSSICWYTFDVWRYLGGAPALVPVTAALLRTMYTPQGTFHPATHEDMAGEVAAVLKGCAKVVAGLDEILHVEGADAQSG